jgi:hypothetical protein
VDKVLQNALEMREMAVTLQAPSLVAAYDRQIRAAQQLKEAVALKS